MSWILQLFSAQRSDLSCLAQFLCAGALCNLVPDSYRWPLPDNSKVLGFGCLQDGQLVVSPLHVRASENIPSSKCEACVFSLTFVASNNEVGGKLIAKFPVEDGPSVAF